MAHEAKQRSRRSASLFSEMLDVAWKQSATKGREFAAAVQAKAIIPADAQRRTVTDAAVRGWRSGATCPEPYFLEALLLVLYPTGGEAASALREAWREAKTGAPLPELQPAPRSNTFGEWEATPKPARWPGQVTLNVHTPSPEDDQDQPKLEVTSSLAALRVPVDFGKRLGQHSVTVSFKSVTLVHSEHGNVVPAKGTELGGSEKLPHPHITYAGGWRHLAVNPKDSTPLSYLYAGHVLCTLQTTPATAQFMDLTLQCQDTDLDPKWDSLPKGLSREQSAVMTRLMQRLGCPEGALTMILAESGLRRRR